MKHLDELPPAGCELCGDFPVHLHARCHPAAPVRELQAAFTAYIKEETQALIERGRALNLEVAAFLRDVPPPGAE